MLDEKDLQAIAQMMDKMLDKKLDEKLLQQKKELDEKLDEKLLQQKKELDEKLDEKLLQQKKELDEKLDERLLQQKEEIIHDVGVLMESYFDPKFNFLAENQQIIREKMATKEDLRNLREETQAELFLLKLAVKRNAQEIEELKKAQ